MGRCSSFTSHSFGKLRCFSIQKASAEGFGSIGSPSIVRCIWKKALRNQEPKILKIERIRDSRKVRLRVSGEFRSHHLDQVKAEISRGEPIALDMEEADLVDIEAIRFLNAREDEGVSVLHCSPYIQEWMSRERQEEKARTDWR